MKDLNGRSATIQGYRSILLLSHLCHITQITLPITLLPTTIIPKSLTSLVKRVEVVLKQTKGLFTELSRHPGIDHVARQVVFFIPEDVEDVGELFNQTRERLSSTFRL